MNSKINRRTFIKGSLAASAGASITTGKAAHGTTENLQKPTGSFQTAATPSQMGKICDLQVSRMLLGGNLLTHFTHSRDLKYVYNLTAQYNTEEKIIETMALAEKHGINTLVIHTVPSAMNTLKKYRYEQGGKIQWIICPTAPIEPGLKAYSKQVDELVDMGVDAIYLWGVRGDQLVSQGKMGLLKEAVDIVKKNGIPSGVGAHDLQVIKECEAKSVDADFYIKTFHHHNYQTGPEPEEVKGPTREIPGYWCSDPEEVIKVMEKVEKPWLAFKIMAAGAIPPQNAFPYAFEKGADHILAGMFDFEIAQDAKIAKQALATSVKKRVRPWRS